MRHVTYGFHLQQLLENSTVVGVKCTIYRYFFSLITR